MDKHSLRANEWINIAMEQYLDMVYRLAYARTCSKQDAEDISQEVMLKLIKHSGQIRDEEHLKAWLIRVTANQSSSIFRSAWRRLTVSFEENIPEETQDRENDALDEALGELSGNLRTVVHLYYYEGMTVGEIAETMGIRTDAVKMRLVRARKILKKEMTRMGGHDDV